MRADLESVTRSVSKYSNCAAHTKFEQTAMPGITRSQNDDTECDCHQNESRVHESGVKACDLGID